MRLEAKSHKFGSMTMKLKKNRVEEFEIQPDSPSKLDCDDPNVGEIVPTDRHTNLMECRRKEKLN